MNVRLVLSRPPSARAQDQALRRTRIGDGVTRRLTMTKSYPVLDPNFTTLGSATRVRFCTKREDAWRDTIANFAIAAIKMTTLAEKKYGQRKEKKSSVRQN